MEKTPQETAEEMIQILDEVGWHQGGILDRRTGNGVCVYGALHLTTGCVIEELPNHGYTLLSPEDEKGYPRGMWTEDSNDMGKRLTRAIENIFPERPSHPASFNDSSMTTLEDVKLVIKHAAELEL